MYRFAIRTTKNARRNAKELRRNMTEPERLLWQRLKSQKLGYKFRRQEPLGPYIVDFLCVDKKLIIEVDGGSHATDEAKEYDKKREAYFRNHGLKILRFENHTVRSNMHGVIDTILHALYGEEHMQRAAHCA